MSQFVSDFDKTQRFYQTNRSAIHGAFNDASQLFNVEFDDSAISSLVDRYCGIDYLLQSRGKVYGVAARINFNIGHHRNVTIRYKRKSGTKTEFEKRCESILNETGNIYASITMQIDAFNEDLKRMIVFESDKLYMEIYRNLGYYEKHHMLKNHFDGNLFFKLKYSEIQSIAESSGFRVMIYEPEKNAY